MMFLFSNIVITLINICNMFDIMTNKTNTKNQHNCLFGSTAVVIKLLIIKITV